MPQMGVSVAEGTVVAWRVEVGDRIEADATICEISTDKIDTEVPAPVSGIVAELVVPVETTVEVGTVLARIATGDGDGAGTPAESGEMLAAAEEPAAAQPDTTAPDPTKAQATGAEPAPSGNGATASRSPASARTRRYSPVVQRIAAEHGVDLDQVPGTGRDGRVRKQDVLAFIESAPREEAPLHIESPYRPDPVPSPASAPAGSGGGQLSRMRRQIGEHMKRSLDTTATCTTWIEVD